MLVLAHPVLVVGALDEPLLNRVLALWCPNRTDYFGRGRTDSGREIDTIKKNGKAANGEGIR